MDNITKYINEQGDPFYIKGKQQGIEQGIEQEKRTLAKNLLLTTDFTDERIAQLIGGSVEFVLNIRHQMPKS